MPVIASNSRGTPEYPEVTILKPILWGNLGKSLGITPLIATLFASGTEAGLGTRPVVKSIPVALFERISTLVNPQKSVLSSANSG